MLAIQFLFAIILEGIGAFASLGGVLALGVVATHDLRELHAGAPELVERNKSELAVVSAIVVLVGFVLFVIGLTIASRIIAA